MIFSTPAIVLRSIKYGETSLVLTLFTQTHGVLPVMVKGIRGGKNSKSDLFQPASLLDLQLDIRPQRNFHWLKEYSPAFLYRQLSQSVVHNSVALFCTELLLRLLPEDAPAEDVFDFSFSFFQKIDRLAYNQMIHLPNYFCAQISQMMGYDLSAYFSNQNSTELTITEEQAGYLKALALKNPNLPLNELKVSASLRSELLDWQIQFLHNHSQHMSALKSLSIIKQILH